MQLRLRQTMSALACQRAWLWDTLVSAAGELAAAKED
jgi:hypothetical protein